MPKRRRTNGTTPWAGQVVRLRESAGVLERPDVKLPARIAIHEAVGVTKTDKPGRLLVKLIKAGWNANGSRYYPAKMLERDGPKVATAGTLNFVDHATEAQESERPEGSIKNLASVQVSNAWWDEPSQCLMAEVRLFAPWREAITDMAEHIGMSIRADGLGEVGEAEGRAGLIVNELTRMFSVDYVTRPGAGGGIVSVLESARPATLREAASVGAWLESRLHLALTQFADDMYGDGRLTRDERITLSSAIGDGLQAWASRVEADAPQLYERDRWQEPEPAQPVAVAETSTQPEPPPNPGPAVSGTPTVAEAATTQPSEEPGMSGTETSTPVVQAEAAPQAEPATLSHEARAQIAESQLREAHARITALESLNAALTVERDTVRGEVRRIRNVEAARGAVAAALAAVQDLPEPARARISEALTATPPTTEAGEVDTTALNAQVTRQVEAERAYIASIRESAGEGTPTGLGASTAPQDLAAWKSDLASRFQRTGLNEGAAAAAARR